MAAFDYKKEYKDLYQAQGYRTETAGLRQHHEIYLGDPRKTVPDQLRTVIRHPITVAATHESIDKQ